MRAAPDRGNSQKRGVLDFIREYLRMESAGGMALMLAAALAMLLANSPLVAGYDALLAPITFVVNDGLMAVFFLVVGLELKRELIEGELSTRSKAMLPMVAALGGVLTPAAIYCVLNWDSGNLRGWAIPSATDIAFALGVLALLGRRVPTSLKIFLMAVAVIDDLVAVLIIAVFYTDHLAPVALVMVAGCLIILWGLNRCVSRLWPYLIVGAMLWAAMLLSGVHATVAGVLLGGLIPLPLGKRLIHALHPWVVFGIMPLFAFANAGIPLGNLTLEHALAPLPLGIALGLFAGKQLGIFLASYLLIRLKLAALPTEARWAEFYAVCMLAGIGFTMSLFIGTLAFPDPSLQFYVRLGVMIGSLLSAVFGYIVLSLALRANLKRSEP